MPLPEELIRAGGATLAFDTNAILGFSPGTRRVVFGAFMKMCDDAHLLRTAARPLWLSIVVPSLVHMEVLHDLRVARARGGQAFDAAHVKVELKDKADILAFDEEAAIKASGALHDWFPSDEAWQAAKRERCLEILGLPSSAAPGQGGLASIDWAIAAQADAAGWILVTGDMGAEFKSVSLKMTKAALRTLLDALLHERGV
jgi:hypothetical protein